MSELMNGPGVVILATAAAGGIGLGKGEEEEEFWMLQRRNNGMKRVRRSDRVRRRREDQTRKRGIAQIYRPARSPILKIRKWVAVKSRGLKDGSVG